MSQDDETLELVARALAASDAKNGRDPHVHYSDYRDNWNRMARAAISALPPRLSPELIAKLNALASRLTEQGEYEAVDLIDTVVARVSAMPERELLREALSALDAIIPEAINDRYVTQSPAVERARAAADKIRASLTQEKQT